MAISNRPARSSSPHLLKSGVYYRNREMTKYAHPLQRTSATTSISASSAATAPLPQGKPLSPAPCLGHWELTSHSKSNQKHGPQIHFLAPVPISSLRPARVQQEKAAGGSSSLNAEERLFWDAVSTLVGKHQKKL
mmetsp:Transcript_32014/g.66841  ORF Transcript_32014/g.66841 Transcript_32014/m.66841 type:complete len:135 (-) Transcript_32014:323-727(-)